MKSHWHWLRATGDYDHGSVGRRSRSNRLCEIETGPFAPAARTSSKPTSCGPIKCGAGGITSAAPNAGKVHLYDDIGFLQGAGNYEKLSPT